MQLGTIDRTPPPFFRQGYSALTKLIFFTALSVFMMVADTRFTVVAPLRSGIAAGLAPVQRSLLVPIDLALGGNDYLQGLTKALAAEDAARKQLAWDGTAVGRVREDARKNLQPAVDKVMAQIFAEFPSRLPPAP